MNHRIVSAGLGALFALSATALAQTGVSGQPGVATSLATTPDASSSPTPVIPPPPTPPETSSEPATTPASPNIPFRPTPHPTTPRTSPPPPAGPAPVPAPSGPAAAPAAAPEAPPPAPKAEGKRKGASFYAPYLSESDALDRAILDLTAQVREHPADPGLRNDLGNLLSRRGFAKEARDQYRKAAKLDREFFLADYNEGLLWEKEGKTSPAIRAYERSIKRKPGFPLSRFHLGFLLEKEGRGEAAIEEYAKALRIDPSLRWPARNPLVVQTRLLYRASLANYDRDLAGATLAGDSSFADRAVWERLHPQRPVDTGELEGSEEEEAPIAAATGAPTAAPLIGGKAAPAPPADARRQQLIDRFRRNRVGRPTPNPSQPVFAPAPPAPVAVPPAAVPAPPPPEDENAPNPAMEEPPPPSVAFARSGNEASGGSAARRTSNSTA